MRMLKTLLATRALVLLPPASRPCHPTRLTLVIAFLLGATVLMAPAAASALVCIDGSDNPCPLLPGFNISAFAQVQILDISESFETIVVASNAVQSPDQALIDISAPLSLPVGGATLSALATFRSVVIPTTSGGIISFGTAEATTIIDPLLVTDPVVFPVAGAGFVIRFDSGNTPVAVAFSGNIHVSGAELFFDPSNPGNVDLKARSGGILYRPVELGEPFIGNTLSQDFFVPKPADIPFAFSFVAKPNRTINFSVDAAVFFETYVNLSTNFRDSRLDFTFTATPVPGPSTLALLAVGLVGLVFFRRSKFRAKAS